MDSHALEEKAGEIIGLLRFWKILTFIGAIWIKLKEGLYWLLITLVILPLSYMLWVESRGEYQQLKQAARSPKNRATRLFFNASVVVFAAMIFAGIVILLNKATCFALAWCQ